MGFDEDSRCRDYGKQMIKNPNQCSPGISETITSNKQQMVSEICGGRDVSITSTSLANLEIIRPIGVVSKKVNGARITARSITMCIWRAANQQPSCGAKSQKKLVIATTSDMDDFHCNCTLIHNFLRFFRKIQITDIKQNLYHVDMLDETHTTRKNSRHRQILFFFIHNKRLSLRHGLVYLLNYRIRCKNKFNFRFYHNIAQHSHICNIMKLNCSNSCLMLCEGVKFAVTYQIGYR